MEIHSHIQSGEGNITATTDPFFFLVFVFFFPPLNRRHANIFERHQLSLHFIGLHSRRGGNQT